MKRQVSRRKVSGTRFQAETNKKNYNRNISNIINDSLISKFQNSDGSSKSSTESSEQNLNISQDHISSRSSYQHRCRKIMGKCLNIPLSSNYYEESVDKAQFNSLLIENARRILKARLIKDPVKLNEFRKELIQNKLLNIIIFDIQATGLPEVINGKVINPSIIQISLYQPLTGRQYTSYVNPVKPISFEVGMLSGIYNSFDLKFSLPDLDESCNPTAVEKANEKEYINLSFMDRTEIKELADEYRNEGMDVEEAIDSSIQDFLARVDPAETLLVALDDIDRDNVDEIVSKKAPYMPNILDDIFSFISADSDNTNTILLSHGSALWGEPIFKAELERFCLSDKAENLIFLDTIDLFRNIFKGENMLKESFDQHLGEDRPTGYNSAGNVLSLWGSIEYVFQVIFGRKDMEFITSKIAEEIYLTKKR